MRWAGLAEAGRAKPDGLYTRGRASARAGQAGQGPRREQLEPRREQAGADRNKIPDIFVTIDSIAQLHKHEKYASARSDSLVRSYILRTMDLGRPASTRTWYYIRMYH